MTGNLNHIVANLTKMYRNLMACKNKNPLHKAELKALVRDIVKSTEQGRKTMKYFHASFFKALEVEDWGTSFDDHVSALWSEDMKNEARNHLAYHLQRIGLSFMGEM